MHEEALAKLLTEAYPHGVWHGALRERFDGPALVAALEAFLEKFFTRAPPGCENWDPMQSLHSLQAELELCRMARADLAANSPLHQCQELAQLDESVLLPWTTEYMSVCEKIFFYSYAEKLMCGLLAAVLLATRDVAMQAGVT